MSLFRSAALVSALFCVAACDAAGGSQPTSPDPRAGLREADVQLPPVPSLDIVDVPETYPDGSRSVAGLIRAREDLRGQSIQVTGILQGVYVCDAAAQGVEGEAAALAASPDAGSAVAVRPGCLHPHFHLVDSLRSRQRMLVTGYDAGLYEPQLVAGQRYTISGRYDQQTRGFISTEEGLIVATAVSGEGIVVPPPAEAAPAR